MKKEHTTNNQIKFSKNAKLNAALKGIYEDLQELGSEKVARYKKEFKNEPDFNLAQYGNMIVYYHDIYTFYRNCGYKTTDKYSTDKIWQTYLRQVGYIARHYFN